VSVLDILFSFAVAGLPVGMVLGLVLGLPANREDGGALGGYAGLPRRAARLGHVAAIMLPLIAGFYALAFSVRLPGRDVPLLASSLWMGGAVGLVLTLFLTVRFPKVRYVLPLPATALVVAAGLFAFNLFP